MTEYTKPGLTPAERDSMEGREPRKLFVIGCPRSGTTWVQLLIAQDSAVGTAPETQIFAYYLDHFRRQWQHEYSGRIRPEGAAGLSRLLSETEFEELCRRAAAYVLDRIAASEPQADIIVEKSPRHALHAEFIARLFPDAQFLHVVRDPRDTVASLKAAGQTWGADWAPTNAIVGARMWRDHVEAGRQLANNPNYREIRYEDLRAQPVVQLHGILEWLGLRRGQEQCEQYVATCDIGTLQRGAANDNLPLPSERAPTGFFRKGESGGWKAELSRRDLRVVEYICREPMESLGYRRSGGASKPYRIILHDTIQRVRESLDWQIAKLQLRV